MKTIRTLSASMHVCPMWTRAMLAFLYLGAIAWLSLAASPVPFARWDFPGADKIAHFLMYGGLGAILRWLLWRAGARPVYVVSVLSGTFAYGGLMEVLQSLFTDGMRAVVFVSEAPVGMDETRLLRWERAGGK